MSSLRTRLANPKAEARLSGGSSLPTGQSSTAQAAAPAHSQTAAGQSGSSKKHDRESEDSEVSKSIDELVAFNERSHKKAEEQDARIQLLIQKLRQVDEHSSARIASLEENLVPCTREVKRLKAQNSGLLEDLRAANEAIAAASERVASPLNLATSASSGAQARRANARPAPADDDAANPGVPRIPAGAKMFNIEFQTATGRMIPFRTHKYELIDTIIAKLALSEGFCPEAQRLSFEGRVLEGGRTLGSYGIGEDAVVLHSIRRRNA